MIPSQLYLQGKVAGIQEATTKKGKLWIRLLLETELVRRVRAGEYQGETTILALNCFSARAEQARNFQVGEVITVGAHLYGSQFKTAIGEPKYNVLIVVDRILSARLQQFREQVAG